MKLKEGKAYACQIRRTKAGLEIRPSISPALETVLRHSASPIRWSFRHPPFSVIVPQRSYLEELRRRDSALVPLLFCPESEEPYRAALARPADHVRDILAATRRCMARLMSEEAFGFALRAALNVAAQDEASPDEATRDVLGWILRNVPARAGLGSAARDRRDHAVGLIRAAARHAGVDL